MAVLSVLTILFASGLLLLYSVYRWTYSPNVRLEGTQTHYIYLPDNVDFDKVVKLLQHENVLLNLKSFKTVANLMDYDKQVKAGRYKLVAGMNNYQILAMLRSGHQAPVNVTIHEIRTKERLAQIVSQKLIADSVEIITALNNAQLVNGLGFTPSNILAMFIPNTYQFYWNTQADQFLQRMKKEYDNFWHAERLAKAKALGLTQLEISTLASIIDEETSRNDEKADIAGLYLNRLKKGMPLQADPTIKFALGNFAINRVLSADLKVDSPYNTYKNAGLPPGPIRMPSIAAIDAVLSPIRHDYLYMCAKEDFSGYHNFAKTLDQHNRNAARYRKALRERNIWR
ncbi:MAG: endolytic transglycosylase MltG [Breznakibacter sp.]